MKDELLWLGCGFIAVSLTASLPSGWSKEPDIVLTNWWRPKLSLNVGLSFLCWAKAQQLI